MTDAVELIKKVRKIELKMRGMTNNMLTGSYHSAFKGRGMAFDEVRNYQPGDDVRAIDWNVTARTGEPFIKKYEEERELTVMLMVDVSGSAFAGTGDKSKHELATEIVAILAHSAIRNHDQVGLLLFAEKPVFYLPPGTGSHHLLRIIRELIEVQSQSRSTNIAAAMSYAFNLQKQRSICFVLSDFLDTRFETALKVLAGRHDVIGVHITDPIEQVLPDAGLVEVLDPESGSSFWLDTSDTNMRAEYQRKRRLVTGHEIKQLFQRNKADYLALSTSEPYFPSLLSFFKHHGKRK
jgi:uncharacterized protein (DUF58 family)